METSFTSRVNTLHISVLPIGLADGHFLHLGVAYQLVSLDPLIDTTQCKLDAALMKSLGANAIRVYHVDPTGDHKGCMSAFADVGIYLFVDLDTFDTAISQVRRCCPLAKADTADEECRTSRTGTRRS